MATPVPQTWELIDRGDGRGDMYTAAPAPGPFPTDQELRDAGYLLAKDYGVDSGNADNFTQLENWRAACLADNQAVGYLHYSDQPYLTSNALNWVNRTDYRASLGIPFEISALVGGRDPADPTNPAKRPKVKLTLGAAGFNNPNDVKYVFTFGIVTPDGSELPAPLYNYPDNPLDLPDHWQWFNGNMFGCYFRGIDVDCSGHPGAGGVVFPGAQNCFMGECKITSEGGKAAVGLGGVNATSYPTMGVEVDNFEYAYDFRYDAVTGPNRVEPAAGEMVAGTKITNCTHPFRIGDQFQPSMIVGAEVECPGSVMLLDRGISSQNGLCLVGARIDITGGGNPIAFDNPNDSQMYLRDVYVRGTTNLIKSGNNATITGSGEWVHIEEYVFNRQDAPPASDGLVSATRALVDGSVLSVEEPSTIINNNASDPGTNIRTRCIVTPPRIDDGLEYVDAVVNHAVPVAPADARVQLQAAIDAAETAGHGRVFLRRGAYEVSEAAAGGYGVRLGPNTKLFGIPAIPATFTSQSGKGTYLRVHDSWDPTTGQPMIVESTPGAGDLVISDLCIVMPTGDFINSSTAPVRERFGAVRWRTGGGFTWGLTFQGEAPLDDCPSNKRYIMWFTDQASGKFYTPGVNANRYAQKDIRGAYIEGPGTGPIAFFGQNFEVTKAGGNQDATEITQTCEVVNADNVVIFGQKKEGRGGALIVTDGNNIGYYAGGVHDQQLRDYHVYQGACNNLSIGMSFNRFTHVAATNKRIRENIDGQPLVTIDVPFCLSVYKRGNFNLDAILNQV